MTQTISEGLEPNDTKSGDDIMTIEDLRARTKYVQEWHFWEIESENNRSACKKHLWHLFGSWLLHTI